MDEDYGLQQIGDGLRELIAKDESYHIPADEGDFVNEDGYLCCGKCGTPKEFRRFMEPPLSCWMIVPSMCKCRQEEYAAEQADQVRRKELMVVNELFKFSLTDERFRESTFDNFRATPENTRALTICKNYVQHFDAMYESSTGLLMYGSPGTGKTFSAACIANALMAKGVPVLVTSIVKLTNTSIFSDDLQEILVKMKSARLLILDDFGAERNTDFKVEQIFDVIDSRYASKRPMIITTNIPLDNFKSDPDVRRRRIYDRILEVCHPVKMDWESFRTKAVRDSYDNTKRILAEG